MEKVISVPTNCKEQNTQEDFTEKKNLRKINQNI